MSSFLSSSGPKPLKSAVVQPAAATSTTTLGASSIATTFTSAAAPLEDSRRIASQNILGSISRPDAASLASTLSQMGLTATEHPSSALAIARAGPGQFVSKPASRQSLFAPPEKMPVGVAHIVKKLRNTLKAQGVTSFIGLQRKFRIIAETNNHHGINMHDFKRALLDLNIGLADSETRVLFDHFDAERNGIIDSEEFVYDVRATLSNHRLGLVKEAFSLIDNDGNGLVDAKEIASVYDASKHPEVIAGRKSTQQILTQFLETFDVGGEVDGKVTLDEFVNYYTNIGAAIDSEEYFELMIRNAWHISGNQGVPATSTTRRVLVTRADGSQYLEHVPNEQPKYEEKVEKIQPYYSKWVKPVYESAHTQTFSLFHGDGVPTLVKTKEPATGQNKKTLRDLASADSFNRRDYVPSGEQVRAPTSPPSGGSGGGSVISQDDYDSMRIAQVGPKSHLLDLPTRPATAQPYIPYAPKRSDAKPAAREPSHGVQYIVTKLKAEMKRKGALGFIGLQRKFRIMDDDNDRSLSLSEFKKAMKEMQVDLADSELRMLFEHFDSDRSGGIDFEELVQGVRDPLSDRRRALVELAFSTLDKNGDGAIDGTEIASVYDASHHPDVISGRRTEKQVLQEFLETFDVGGEVDGKVTLQEFTNYYTNIGANIDNDDYFELMVRNAWHLSGGEGGAAAESAAKRVLVTKADGSQVVERAQKPNPNASRDPEALDFTSGLSAATRRRFYTQANSTSSAAMAAFNPGAVAGSVVPKKRANATASTRIPTAAVAVLIDRLKAEMAKRGAHGFIGLQRLFRVMDDDGSKNVDLGEFKDAIKHMSISLSDTELRLVFDHFDVDNSGTIDFEEFVQGVRDPLDERRLELVKQAFTRIDLDGSGVVDATEIAKLYDASKHPEVIAGRKTTQQVLREFLETFDVGGEVDGMVTLKEFINYYTNIGASIDNDDYFELMIHNAWHISGGEGWSENSSNKRVLVTHSDGSQTVEEIKNDLGLKGDDLAGTIARLKAQGVDVVDVSANGSTSQSSSYEEKTTDSVTVQRATSSQPSPSQQPRTGNSARAVLSQGGKNIQNLGKLAKKVARDPLAISVPAGTRTRSSGGNARSAIAPNDPYANDPQERFGNVGVGDRKKSVSRQMTHGTAMLIARLKLELKQRAAVTGFIGLQRKFRILDDDNNKQLSLAEFKKAMKEMNLNLSDSEVRILFDYFDTDRSGGIDFEEFIQGVRDPLSERRLVLVKLAFKQLDLDDNGIVDAAEIASIYDASKHPEVIAGRKSTQQILTQFLETFDVGGEVDGKVTLQEFTNYYTNIGASIDSDDYFELMIRNAWHISGGEGWSENSSNKRVLVTHSDGSQEVEEIKNDLGLKNSGDYTATIARLKVPQPQPQGSLQGGVSESWENGEGSYKPLIRRTHFAHASSIRFGDDSTVLTDSDLRSSSRPNAEGKGKIPVEAILSRLKRQLSARGAHGIVGLQRKFRVMDDDRSGAFSREEFAKGIRESSLSLNNEECDTLFQYFDKDGNGEIDFEEFLQGVRGPLSEKRKILVDLAFNKLDKDGNGLLEPSDIIQCYDARHHPEVLSGKKRPDDILREFLDTFDVGGVVDGKVTREEFENYYANVGANIVVDTYFELMIRNAWHISGGEGMAANTSNLRVLVTKADGSQHVEEVKDDLVLRRDDAAGIAAQRISAAAAARVLSARSSVSGGGSGIDSGGVNDSFTAGSTGDKLFGVSSRAGENAPLGRFSKKVFVARSSISIN